ncbi:hypothetical protein EB155_01765, partial [archaeon]|nr:hypothetical protein [archaeon]
MILKKYDNSTFFNPFGGNILHTKIDKLKIEKTQNFINEFERISKLRESTHNSKKHKVIQTNSSYDLENNTITEGEIRMIDMFIQKNMGNGIIEDIIYELVKKYNEFSLNEYKNIVEHKCDFLLSDKKNAKDYVKSLEE